MDYMDNCPFCGGDPSLHLRSGRKGYFIYVSCEVCGASTRTISVDDSGDDWAESYEAGKAISLWNRRVNDAE